MTGGTGISSLPPKRNAEPTLRLWNVYSNAFRAAASNGPPDIYFPLRFSTDNGR